MALLDEAIIEAGQLREAATLQAKNDIIDKYASEIRNRMNSLLNESVLDEGPEDDLDAGFEDDLGSVVGGDMGGEDDSLDFEDDLEITDTMGMGDGGGTETDYMDDQIPMGFINDDEEIEIDFNELVDMIDDAASGDMMDREETAEEIVGTGEDGLDMETEFDMEDDDGLDMEDNDLDSLLEELEAEFLKTNDDEDDEEILTDDGGDDCEDAEVHQEGHKAGMKGVGKGWAPRPQSELEHEMARNTIAKKYDSVFDTEGEETETSSVKNSRDSTKMKRDEKNRVEAIKQKELDAKEKDLQLNENKITIKKLLREKNVINEKNKLLYDKLVEAKEVIDMIILDNEKQKLKVEIYKNDRLNGRQRERIVEALENAETLNEAQSIFELQNVTASKMGDKNPVREAMKNLPRNQTHLKGGVLREQKEVDPVVDQMENRWQQIAGIKKSS